MKLCQCSMASARDSQGLMMHGNDVAPPAQESLMVRKRNGRFAAALCQLLSVTSTELARQKHGDSTDTDSRNLELGP